MVTKFVQNRNMALSTLLTLGLLAAQNADPLQLPIGAEGKIKVAIGSTLDTTTGKGVEVDAIVNAAKGVKYVFLGESHNNPKHHEMQAKIIDALAKSGRQVIVGFEMFTRPVQDELNPWTLGWESEDEFIQKADWKKQWGYDFALYRPIFTVTREDKLPMVALNVPRDWVRSVGKGGYAALTANQKKELPDNLNLGNKSHKEIFTSMMGGHPMTGSAGDNMYAAQVLWDEGMADTAIKYMAKQPNNPNKVFVVVAGAGHVMYRQGINWRIKQRTGESGITVVMVDGTEPVPVSKGIADFVYAAEPGK